MGIGETASGAEYRKKISKFSNFWNFGGLRN